ADVERVVLIADLVDDLEVGEGGGGGGDEGGREQDLHGDSPYERKRTGRGCHAATPLGKTKSSAMAGSAGHRRSAARAFGAERLPARRAAPDGGVDLPRADVDPLQAAARPLDR